MRISRRPHLRLLVAGAWHVRWWVSHGRRAVVVSASEAYAHSRKALLLLMMLTMTTLVWRLRRGYRRYPCKFR